MTMTEEELVELFYKSQLYGAGAGRRSNEHLYAPPSPPPQAQQPTGAGLPVSPASLAVRAAKSALFGGSGTTSGAGAASGAGAGAVQGGTMPAIATPTAPATIGSGQAAGLSGGAALGAIGGALVAPIIAGQVSRMLDDGVREAINPYSLYQDAYASGSDTINPTTFGQPGDAAGWTHSLTSEIARQYAAARQRMWQKVSELEGSLPETDRAGFRERVGVAPVAMPDRFLRIDAGTRDVPELMNEYNKRVDEYIDAALNSKPVPVEYIATPRERVKKLSAGIPDNVTGEKADFIDWQNRRDKEARR